MGEVKLFNVFFAVFGKVLLTCDSRLRKFVDLS